MDAIASAGLKIGVDPMGGAGVALWDPIAERYGLDIEVVNRNGEVYKIKGKLVVNKPVP